jgi:acetyltransferase-like isoleucine patch superfamily enzyme
MSFKIGQDCQIHPSAIINVKEGSLGDRCIVQENARIEGTKVVIGNEAFIDRMATIGGGSCFDPQAELICGDWLHMGVNAHINIARGVYIGHEFGCGIETKVFTHGAYIDSYALGAPTQWGAVHIGNSVWCPNAWINPGVRIGDQVVIAARSLVNRDVPDNCLAGGSPLKIIKENYLPKAIDKNAWGDQILEQTIARCWQKGLVDEADQISFDDRNDLFRVKNKTSETVFDVNKKEIFGNEKYISEVLKDQLRRNGVRFRYEYRASAWLKWSSY